MTTSVARKITLGTAALLLLWSLLVAVVLTGLYSVHGALRDLSDHREPLHHATQELEVNVNGVKGAVLMYLDRPDQRWEDYARIDAQDVETEFARYRQLATTAEGQRLAAEFETLYGSFSTAGETLIRLARDQEMQFTLVTRQAESIDELIDERLQDSLDLNDIAQLRKYELLNGVEADLAEVGMWLATFRVRAHPTIADDLRSTAREIRGGLAKLKREQTTPVENEALAEVTGRFDVMMKGAEEVLAREQELQSQLEAFIAAHRALDDLLDEEMQAGALAMVQQPRERAATTMRSVIGLALTLVFTATAAAVIVVIWLVRSVHRPLVRLKEGAQAVSGGSLNHRIVDLKADEFGEVAMTFNNMLDRLEETLVSKAALAGSEAELRRTVEQLRREAQQRRYAQEQQERLAASLRRAETMSAMGVLVGGVAHQVRNPLFGISSIADAMLNRFGADAEIGRYASALKEPVERLGRLMQELLDYGRPSSAAQLASRLDEIVSDAVAACQSLAGQFGVRVRLCEGDAVFVNADRAALTRAVENLIDNAVRHTPRGGVVEAEVVEAGGEAICTVRDGGPGFDAESLDRAFEPFFSRRKGGTGLGLPLAHRIIEEHGGSVIPTNDAGKGGVVTIRLPVVNDLAESKQETSCPIVE